MKLYFVPLLLFLINTAYGQCLAERYKSKISNEIKKFADLNPYKNLAEGEVQQFHFNSNGRDGRFGREGDFKVKKMNGELYFFSVGINKSYVDNKIWSISFYDSCGRALREDYYTNYDSIKTGFAVFQEIILEEKIYELSHQEFDHKNQQLIKEEIMMPNHTTKRHGMYRKVINGKLVADKKYYFGKVVKNNL